MSLSFTPKGVDNRTGRVQAFVSTLAGYATAPSGKRSPAPLGTVGQNWTRGHPL